MSAETTGKESIVNLFGLRKTTLSIDPRELSLYQIAGEETGFLVNVIAQEGECFRTLRYERVKYLGLSSAILVEQDETVPPGQIAICVEKPKRRRDPIRSWKESFKPYEEIFAPFFTAFNTLKSPSAQEGITFDLEGKLYVSFYYRRLKLNTF